MRWWSSWLDGAARVVRTEVALFSRHPRLRISAAAILLVPALYALIYLSSVWDPVSHTSSLPVGVVNLDRGVTYRGISANVGDELVSALRRQAMFGYRIHAEAESARKAVREGVLDFALIIPAEFSQLAVPGTQAGAGKLIIYTSEGNNYTGAAFARQFAPAVVREVNETLTRKRWELVLSTAADSRQTLQRLHEGADLLVLHARELSDGAALAQRGTRGLEAGVEQAARATERLRSGSAEVSQGATQMSGGVKRLAAALHALDAARPPEAELNALREGTHALAAGSAELSAGLQMLAGGAPLLTDGLRRLKDEGEQLILVGGTFANGAAALEDGARQLSAGLSMARERQAALAAGAKRVDEGAERLTLGLGAMSSSLQTILSRVPDDARLDAFAGGARQLSASAAELADGTRRLHEGAHQLVAGLGTLEDGTRRLGAGVELLKSALPRTPDLPDGDAGGLTASVEPTIEIAAPVPNNGTGFAPNFVPVALWIGAVMAVFLFYPRQIAESLADTPSAARVLGKFAVPAAIALAQALLMLLMLTLVLDVRLSNPVTFALTLAVASFSFLAMILMLILVLGDAGKMAALVLLIVQLSSAGALLPIELSSGFFEAVHWYLPLTWVVRAFRATMFGAYDNAWFSAWAMVAAAGVAAMLIAILAARWKTVPDESYRPAIEI